MEYIYIKTKPDKCISFRDLLDSLNIYFDYVGYNTFMIHKCYFNTVWKILDNYMIESFASEIKSL